MADDLQRRIATVLVRSQHGTLPAGKIAELVDLGVGMATAALIVRELENRHDDQLTDDQPCRCHQPCRSKHGGRRCTLRLGHAGDHCEDPFLRAGSFVWTDLGADPDPANVAGGWARVAAAVEQLRDDVAAIRGDLDTGTVVVDDVRDRLTRRLAEPIIRGETETYKGCP